MRNSQTALAFAKVNQHGSVQWRDGHYTRRWRNRDADQTALRALRVSRPDLVERVRGLKANASPLSPEELDKLNHLAATDVRVWARDELACAREFDLAILGGCCGTDERYIEALAKAVVG